MAYLAGSVSLFLSSFISVFSVSVFKENVCCLRPRECEYIRKQKL